jgi:hypothetical protein
MKFPAKVHILYLSMKKFFSNYFVRLDVIFQFAKNTAVCAKANTIPHRDLILTLFFLMW